MDAVQCGDVGCAGAMCTAGWCKCARGVALWRGWGIPLKGAALGSCQTRPSGDIRLPALKKTTMELGLPEKFWRWTRTVRAVGVVGVIAKAEKK